MVRKLLIPLVVPMWSGMMLREYDVADLNPQGSYLDPVELMLWNDVQRMAD